MKDFCFTTTHTFYMATIPRESWTRAAATNSHDNKYHWHNIACNIGVIITNNSCPS